MIIKAANAPEPIGPYSHAVSANGFVFLSGQIPVDENGDLIDGGVEEQTERALKNIEAILSAAGLGFGDVVKSCVFMKNMDDFSKINEVYARVFKENPPARSAVQVAALPKGSLVEIEVVAAAR
ncbi:MAG: RidA family protein [Clostridiales bacterium]|jgi:2-iminobutanoate/2-iminopropanoate deaminase|nr:RidA family protein [Clostridiales bacterium]